jgi:hypothetical protein
MFATPFRLALALALVASFALAGAPAQAQLGTKPPQANQQTQKKPLKPLGSVGRQAKPKKSVMVGSGASRHEMTVH